MTVEITNNTEAKLVEAYAAKIVQKEEKPFYQNKYYSRNVFGNTYRINFYREIDETIRSIMVKVVNGQIQIVE